MAKVLDTNILVYAHREDAPLHSVAWRLLRDLDARAERVGLPWPCLYEFLRVVTHPRVWKPPSPIEQAWQFVADLLALPSLEPLGAGDAHASLLADLVARVRPSGNLVHDAHIAALALEHGFREVVTEDSDFHRFPGLTVVPLERPEKA